MVDNHSQLNSDKIYKIFHTATVVSFFRVYFQPAGTYKMAMGRKKLPAKDRHKSGFMLRLPEPFRTLLDSITAETHRSLTVEVQLALIEYAKKHGKPAPKVGGE